MDKMNRKISNENDHCNRCLIDRVLTLKEELTDMSSF